MQQKLVKCFRFEEKNRSGLTFSDPTRIRLNPDTNRLELAIEEFDRVTGVPLYYLNTDLYVTSWVTNPTTLLQWIGFSVEPHESKQPNNTTIRYRLNDGTNDRYWDSAQWAIAGSTDWNTEDEISANIDTFPATDQKIGVIVNLVTTDPMVTPYIESADFLMLLEIDYMRSIADSLIDSFVDAYQANADFAIRAPGGDLISLKDLETPFEILAVDEAYNEDTDPEHQLNIASSWDGASKMLTLSTSIDRGTKLWVRFTFSPRVYLNWPSQDYSEVEKLPAVVIDNFDISGNEIYAESYVRDKANNQATVRRFVFRLSLEFDIVLLAEKNRTLLVLMDFALKHAADNPLLRWKAVDENVFMMIQTEGLFRPRPNLGDIHTTRYSLRLEEVYLWLRPEEVKPLIQNFNLTLTDPTLAGGPRWTGIK